MIVKSHYCTKLNIHSFLIKKKKKKKKQEKLKTWKTNEKLIKNTTNIYLIQIRSRKLKKKINRKNKKEEHTKKFINILLIIIQ